MQTVSESQRAKDPTLKSLLIQAGLAAQGLNPGPLDNVWGKQSEAAYRSFMAKASTPTPADPVDERSEGNIATLDPNLHTVARNLVRAAAAQGIEIKIISGTRTYEEQDALFAKKPKVTNAKGGYSNHNFGVAFDIGIFKGGKYIPESKDYKTVGEIGKSLGLEWGGDWKSIVDEPHFEMTPERFKGMKSSDRLAAYRKLKSEGKPIF